MRHAEKIVIAIICIIIASAVFAPFLTSYDPNGIDLDSIKEAPSWRHIFGTDTKGRDIFSRVLYGGRISLSVSFIAALVSMGLGIFLGLTSGYAGGKIDSAIVSLIDLVLSFPSLLLAIGISVVLPPGIYTVMIAIAAVGWASFARLIRGYVVTLRGLPYIEAAKAVGCSHWRIIFLHLLPQCIPVSIIVIGLKLGGYIITEASLSFLGLGPQPPAPSWGGMVSAGRAFILSESWMVLFPGMAIALAALSFNLLGDVLREKYGLKLK